MVAEVRVLAREIERRANRAEEREAWGRVRTLGHRIHLAVVADRPDVAHDAAGAIVTLADRRLRQLNGGPGGNAA